MKISVIHPCYNHVRALPDHIKNWNEWRDGYKKRTEIILVDDGSPDAMKPEHFKQLSEDIDIKVFRILEDIKWNVSGARNLGLTQATGDWLFPLDFDMSVINKTFEGFFKEKLDSRTTYWPKLWFPSDRNPTRIRHPHCNSFFIKKDVMMESGLYDEDFAGEWGWEDIFVHNFLFPSLGMMRKEMDEGCIRWYKRFVCRTQHGEVVVKRPKDRTTHNYDLMMKKGKEVSAGTYKNGPILRFKWERIV